VNREDLAARLARFDDVVDRAFDKIRTPAVDQIAYPLSSAADHSLLWHGMGIARAVNAGDIASATRFSIAMGIESALTNGPIKALFGRLRPVDLERVEFRAGLRRPITSSFPSGHATAAFCAATLLGGGPSRYALAALVASTRIYVRLHHASDVVGGAVLGVALGVALRPLVRVRGGSRERA
jgi:membrane-associated phospholipid phosphatase